MSNFHQHPDFKVTLERVSEIVKRMIEIARGIKRTSSYEERDIKEQISRASNLSWIEYEILSEGETLDHLLEYAYLHVPEYVEKKKSSKRKQQEDEDEDSDIEMYDADDENEEKQLSILVNDVPVNKSNSNEEGCQAIIVTGSRKGQKCLKKNCGTAAHKKPTQAVQANQAETVVIS